MMDRGQEIWGRRSVLAAGLAVGAGAKWGRGLWRHGALDAGLGKGLACVLDPMEGHLLELDRNLVPCGKGELRAPRLGAFGGGRLWVFDGEACGRLKCGQGRAPWNWESLGPPWQLQGLQLAADPGGSALLWALRGGMRELCRLNSAGELQVLGVFDPGVQGFLGSAGFLCHDARTEQWLSYGIGTRSPWVRAVRPGAPRCALAVEAAPSGWWLASHRPEPLLERRDARLGLLWSRPLGFRARCLVDVGDGVLALGGKPLRGQRFDHSGRARVEQKLGVHGSLRGAIRFDKSILVAIPGALLTVSPEGAVLRTQGGFGHIAALVGYGGLVRLG